MHRSSHAPNRSDPSLLSSPVSPCMLDSSTTQTHDSTLCTTAASRNGSSIPVRLDQHLGISELWCHLNCDVVGTSCIATHSPFHFSLLSLSIVPNTNRLRVLLKACLDLAPASQLAVGHDLLLRVLVRALPCIWHHCSL
jgi:hypothetical protein